MLRPGSVSLRLWSPFLRSSFGSSPSSSSWSSSSSSSSSSSWSFLLLSFRGSIRFHHPPAVYAAIFAILYPNLQRQHPGRFLESNTERSPRSCVRMNVFRSLATAHRPWSFAISPPPLHPTRKKIIHIEQTLGERGNVPTDCSRLMEGSRHHRTENVCWICWRRYSSTKIVIRTNGILVRVCCRANKGRSKSGAVVCENSKSDGKMREAALIPCLPVAKGMSSRPRPRRNVDSNWLKMAKVLKPSPVCRLKDEEYNWLAGMMVGDTFAVVPLSLTNLKLLMVKIFLYLLRRRRNIISIIFFSDRPYPRHC